MMAELKPPIILVGNARSGTTMTLQCFGVLDALVSWHEPRTIWTSGIRDLGHDRFTAEQATPQVVHRVRHDFLEYQEAHGGRRIAEKTPSNSLRIPFIRAVFSEARFLHLYRDGRDSVSSALRFWTRPPETRRIVRRLKETRVTDWPRHLPRFLREHVGLRLGLVKRKKNWGVVYPGMQEDLKRMELIEVIAKQWVASVETARQDLAQLDPGQWLECSYEELVADPHKHIGRFLDFFDLGMTPALEEHLNGQIRRDSIGSYKQRLTQQQIDKITPIMRPTLEKLGYTIE